MAPWATSTVTAISTSLSRTGVRETISFGSRIRGPGATPTEGSQWKRHAIGAIGNLGKDVKLRTSMGTAGWMSRPGDRDSVMIFFQTDRDIWTRMEFTGVRTGEEGMTSGDLNGDGAMDLVLCGVWLRNPGKALARNQADLGSAHDRLGAEKLQGSRGGRERGRPHGCPVFELREHRCRYLVVV